MPANFSLILQQNLAHLAYITPELTLAFTFIAALLFDLFAPPAARRGTAYVCLLGVLISMGLTVSQNGDFVRALGIGQGSEQVAALSSKAIFGGMIVHDHFATFFKFLLLLGTAISLLLSLHSKELDGKHQGEFHLLTVAVCLGGMFLASSSNLLMIYVALEALSIVSYAMAGYLRRDRKSAEAGIKYVIYGAMASGIMLFGMSYLYGLTGTLHLLDTPFSSVPGIATQLIDIQSTLPHEGRGAVIAILALVFVGFLYKIAAVPFHYWSPDVYEGAPTAAAGFFSVVPKAAGFAVLIRVLCAFCPPGDHAGAEKIMAILAVLTMTLGNLAALGQTNAKRMLAYSSIAHAGYMLAGLSVLGGTLAGPASVLFYLVVYLFMNLGAFLVIIALENRFGGADLVQLRGAVRREPLLVVALCVFLFSLVGLPPFAGFTAKYLVMLELAARGHYGMVFWIGVNSVISLYYYMKLAKTVAIDAPVDEPLTQPASSPIAYKVLAAASSFALLALFVRFEPITTLCKQVMEPLMGPMR